MPKRQKRLNVRAATIRLFEQGDKDLFIRPDDWLCPRFQPDDVVVFCAMNETPRFTARIRAVRRYETLDQALANEDLTRLGHGSAVDQTREYLRLIWTRTDERFGVVSLELTEIQLVESAKKRRRLKNAG